jgi:predicted flap endonuclease-1-like 5' DNA nuclease
MRRSSHAVNVDILKNLKAESKKDKKKEPFTYKEKKRTTFKVTEEKVKAGPTEIEKEEIIPTEKGKKTPIKKEKVKVKKEVPITGEAKKEGLPLNSLSGLGPASVSKFKDLGVETVDQLIKEDPSELASLLKGISEERIKKWIEEGKELLK